MRTNLEDSLYKHESNKENFDSLIETYTRDANIFVAFLGSGIGSALKEVPDNQELYDKQCERHKFVGKSDSDEGPQLFNDLYDYVEHKEMFDQEIFQLVTPRDTSGTATHSQIARAFNCFVTTNFYDPIEKIFEDRQEEMEKKPDKLSAHYFSFPEDNAKFTLTYLHGHKRIGFCILRQNDYRYFYPSLYEKRAGVYAVENSLRHIFTKRIVVFLGCSLEPHLKNFFEYLSKKVEKDRKSITSDLLIREVKTHYWITSDSQIRQFLNGVPDHEQNSYKLKYFDNFRKINIRPIVYVGDHIFIEDLCKTLARKLKSSITSPTSIHDDPSRE